MLNNNFKNIAASDIMSFKPTYRDINNTVFTHSVNGDLAKIGNYFGTAKIPFSSDAVSLSIGAGTTPPTKDDYILEQPLDLTNFTILSGVKTSSQTIDGSVTFSQTWSYSGDNDVTISEVGLFTSGYSSGYKTVMLAREVLNVPITVSNGDTFTVSMTIG